MHLQKSKKAEKDDLIPIDVSKSAQKSVDNLSEALGSDTLEPAVKRVGEVSLSKDRTEDSEDKAEREAREFRDSTAFLKGTQSLNPHNDYSQNFVDTGQRPQNFIRDTGEAGRRRWRWRSVII